MKEMTFEDILKRLDEIVGLLKSGDLPLEKSLDVFQEGSKLINDCNKMLNEAEQKLTIIRDGKEEDYYE